LEKINISHLHYQLVYSPLNTLSTFLKSYTKVVYFSTVSQANFNQNWSLGTAES